MFYFILFNKMSFFLFITEAEGGGINSDYNIRVEWTTFSGCCAGINTTSGTTGGGGLAVSWRDCNISNTAFLFCESRLSRIGGGIRVYSSNLECTNCTFLNCLSSVGGGAVCFITNGKTLKLIGCIFGSNVAGKSGGAINSGPSTLTCEKCSFLHNSGTTKGGAVYCGGSATFTNTVFIRNIKNGDGTCSVSDMSSGGAILQASGTLTLTDCTFNTNRNVNGNCNGMFFFFFFDSTMSFLSLGLRFFYNILFSFFFHIINTFYL
jgi:predicted outer membrane repeat protein